MNNNDKFIKYREQYKEFIYEKHDIVEDNDTIKIKYYFNIPGLTYFYPQLIVNKKYIKNDNINKDYLNYLVFHIGMIELISYYKCVCPKKVIIKNGYLDNEQIKWFKKLYFNGLGEFLYTNKITITEDELMDIECQKEKIYNPNIEYQGKGNLICIGGGKDSCVSLEILRNEIDNSPFIINAKTPSIECAKIAGYNEEEIIKVDRILDRKIVELNSEGYLNGHTPFSSLVAFVSYLVAYLNNKENIVLSNESSSNQATVIGTNINHQYSKSYEFENDFNNYTKKYLKTNINYFSILRGLSEFNIAKLFANYKKYHPVFKSCNLGSKEKEWNWCCKCPKCLFVYIILSPFLYKEELVNIFKEDLYEKEDLLNTFIEIIGYSETKPFECVGTYEEARYAVSLVINRLNTDNLPYLLKYYKDNYKLELNNQIEEYNNINNINDYYNELVKGELKKYENTNS